MLASTSVISLCTFQPASGFDRDLFRRLTPSLEPQTFDTTLKAPAIQPQATAMISMFMQGGPSHIDLFDPKPELNRLHMKTSTGDIKYGNAGEASSKLFGCPWRFRKYGECGMDLSELVSKLGGVADDNCLIRSMHTGVDNHGESINAFNTGRPLAGRPSLGSWMTYGMGSDCSNLPAFMVLTDPSGLPVLGVENWQNGWLPSVYQGTVVRSQEPRILNLDPPLSLKGANQEKILSYLRRVNQSHLTKPPGEHDLAARMQSNELAAGIGSLLDGLAGKVVDAILNKPSSLPSTAAETVKS